MGDFSVGDTPHFRGRDDEERRIKREHEARQRSAARHPSHTNGHEFPYTEGPGGFGMGLMGAVPSAEPVPDYGPRFAHEDEEPLTPADPRWRWPSDEERAARREADAARHTELDIASRRGINQELVERMCPGTLVQHFKGGVYLIIDPQAAMEATSQPVVVYQSVTDHRTWVRDLEIFTEMVEHEGELKPRFEYVALLPRGFW